jgi:cardiolipin synthase
MTSPQDHTDKEQDAWRITIPNLLTVIRILLTPLFVIFLIRDHFGSALLVFFAAGVSDGLDGLIARYFNQRTTLGAILDPIADKMLLAAAYVSLGVLAVIPGWLTVMVITRDVVILLGVAIFSFMKIDFEVKPTIISKITTVLQVVTVCLALLRFDRSGIAELQLLFYWVTAAFTILSGLHYIFLGMGILQRGPATGAGDGRPGEKGSP